MRKALSLGFVTLREVLSQPLPWIVCGITSLLLLFSTVLPSFTLEPEGDLKFMMDVGLGGVGLGLLVIGLWPATTLLVDELRERTVLTLLSKPLSRPQYLLGRTLGIAGALAVSAALLGAWFLACAWLTESQVLGAKLDFWLEGVQPQAAAAAPIRWHLLGMVLLALAQAVILCAVAVALSTLLGPLPNLACCLAVFCLGHLGEHLSREGGVFVWALRVGVPHLACFETSGAVARGIPLPASYVAACLGYAALYVTAVLAVAIPLFERREIS
jgi:ABC-type transport system involved in multi-copper enzyme maturation permease subunit